MNGWHMGIGHVRHETDSCGEKLRIFIRAMTCLCKLQGEGAADCRNIHAYLFENAALHHAADAAAAFAWPEPLSMPIPGPVSQARIASVLTLDLFAFQAHAIATAPEPLTIATFYPLP